MRKLNKDIIDAIRDDLACKGNPEMWKCKHDKTRRQANVNIDTSIHSAVSYGVNTYEKA